MLVESFLTASARRWPDKPALVCGARRPTYAELSAESQRVASLLREHGVGRGDRVVIHLENSVEAVVSAFAVLRAGGVFVIVNPSVKPAKLRSLLNDCRATVAVTDARRADALRPDAETTPHLSAVVVAGGQVGAASTAMPTVPFEALPVRDDHGPGGCIDLDLAALIYTSGSSGVPKGVMLTHRNIVAAATSITTYLESTPDDVVLSALPLSFDYGLYQVLMAFKVGATVVLERSFTYPHAVLDLIARERVTGFPIVPTIAAILRQVDLAQYDLASLRYVTNTGAALPVEHVRALRRALPHVRLYSMYGLTECKRVSYLSPSEIDARPESVGRAMPNVEAYLVDEAGRRIEAGVGELVIRGANVMQGYWERPDETDRVLKPGPLPGERVLHSGDIFRMDDDGYLYFVARRDDIIKTRGEKVSPKEVENVIQALDGVLEAVVVGIEDPVLGSAVKAIVTPRDGAVLSEADVLRHCARQLEDFMVPKAVEFRAALPRTSTGKVDKRALHALDAR